MMRASYFDPASDKAVEAEQCSGEDVPGLIDVILALRSQRGYPTLELMTSHGATLSLSTDGESAYLVWTSSLGDSVRNTEYRPRALRARLIRVNLVSNPRMLFRSG